MMLFTFLVTAALTGSVPGEAIPLWADAIPMSVGQGEGHTPSITPYFPASDRATGTAIVVCPGGGYGGLALKHEGEDVAQWLNSEGIAAFVLRYRHAPDYKNPVPLMDAQRAIRLVRFRAGEWGIDPGRIGILGFSAGGHLTTSAAVFQKAGDAQSKDPVDKVSSRPDFFIPIYPVINMDGPYAHMGSRKNLIGENPDPALVQKMCLEKQVTSETPPAFIVASSEDTGVPAENSVMLYLSLHQAKIPVEMHIYEKGPHGFGLGPNDPVLSTWPKHCIDWLRGRGMLK